MSIEDFLQKRSDYSVIDVRSPSEYKQGHIHGAINIPLFQDNERAIVGTLYKQQGKYEAVKAGLDMLGPKLSAIIRQSRKVIKGNEALIYCWRGGLRSESFAWLLNLSEIKCQVLKDGYKAYRRFHLTTFLTYYQLMVLGGPTGSGKTEVLHEKGPAHQESRQEAPLRTWPSALQPPPSAHGNATDVAFPAELLLFHTLNDAWESRSLLTETRARHQRCRAHQESRQ